MSYFFIQFDNLPPAFWFGFAFCCSFVGGRGCLVYLELITYIVELKSTMLLYVFCFSHLSSFFFLLFYPLWTNQAFLVFRVFPSIGILDIQLCFIFSGCSGDYSMHP